MEMIKSKDHTTRIVWRRALQTQLKNLVTNNETFNLQGQMHPGEKTVRFTETNKFWTKMEYYTQVAIESLPGDKLVHARLHCPMRVSMVYVVSQQNAPQNAKEKNKVLLLCHNGINQ
jgi:hypothetical protein